MRVSLKKVDKKKRCISLDIFRALMIVLFVFFNLLGTFVPQEQMPFFLKHNQGPVLLFVDLIAPAFAFILGASLYFPYQKRLRERYFLLGRAVRFLQLILIGIILDGLFCKGLLSFCLSWGVLQSLGLGGLFALLFIKFDNKLRLILFFLLLVIYSQLDIHLLPFPSSDPFRHGGVIGGVGYGFVSLLGVISAEMFVRDRRKLFLLGTALFILALAASRVTPFNKLEVTASFILISSALSIFFWLLLSSFKSLAPRIFNTLSRNSLSLWTLQYILVWYPISIFNLWVTKFDIIGGAFISAFLTALLICVVTLLGRKR